MFNYSDSDFLYKPYPIGAVQKIIDSEKYFQLSSTFPTDISSYKITTGNKYYLNEKEEAFHSFLQATPCWKDFYLYCKSRNFIEETLQFLLEKNIDLGYRGFNLIEEEDTRLFRIKKAYKYLKTGTFKSKRLRAYFEFSILDPEKKSCVEPHTDGMSKVVSMVIYMPTENEWNIAWGGGTDMLYPLTENKIFNKTNQNKLSFNEMSVLNTFDFQPNRCVIFPKTFNSWHGVSEMSQDAIPKLRKSITLNILSS